MTSAEIASYLSLVLAFIFWMLSTKQSNDAQKTLNEIKTEILTWQAQLNKAAIDIISSRPEIIAKQTEMEEAKSLADFNASLSELIGNLSKEPGGDYQIAFLEKILNHHKNLILGKQQIMAQVLSSQSGQNSPKPDK